MTPPWLKSSSGAVSISIKVQPRAAKNTVCSADGPELHVRIAAPPVDDEANVELVRFLSKILDCPRNCVVLRRGHTSRHKVVEITGLTPETIAERLLPKTHKSRP